MSEQDKSDAKNYRQIAKGLRSGQKTVRDFQEAYKRSVAKKTGETLKEPDTDTIDQIRDLVNAEPSPEELADDLDRLADELELREP